LVWACGGTKKEEVKAKPETPELSYQIKSTIPHDVEAFTQGFYVHNGELYESTGQAGSWIGIVDVNTGKANKKVILPDQYFGEGITILNNKVYQLTWQNKKGFVYDLKTFKKLKEFEYSTEGWGITSDGKSLIMSDGSHKLFYMDTTTLKTVKTLEVKYQNAPMKELNELEFVNGYIYANIWQTDRIVKINPANGEVVATLDLENLSNQAKMINPQIDVLNGIAWHEKTKSFLVTGKYWPFIYVLNVESMN
jgi:glutamine cyclotransferase